MKRSDLQVGGEYLHSSYNDWQEVTGPSAKVTVLSVEPWLAEDSWRHSGQPRSVSITLPDGRVVEGRVDGRPDPKGNRVLVQVSNGRGSQRIELVTLGQIKAPWAEALALIEERREANEQRVKEKRQRWEAEAQEREDLQRRIVAASGCDVVLRWAPGGAGREVVISVEALEALLSR